MHQPARPRLLLACVVFGLALLAYAPAPADADGQAVLAVAVSLARFGAADIDAIGHTEWLLTASGSMGSRGLDGALYAKKGPAPSLLLLPFVALADALPWLTVRATAMLFNALALSAAAVLLYSFARRLGYGAWVSLAVGLAYSAATFAITYVKTLFGEPLAGLLLLGAAMCVHAFRAGGGRWRLAAGGGLLALCAGINTAYALLALPLAAYLLWPPAPPFPLSARRGEGVKALAGDAAAFAAPLAAGAAFISAYNGARFGSPLASGYGFEVGEGFITPLGVGLYGMLLSPYRGVFWYNPLLLLALPGWLLFRRRHGRLAWLILALAALQLVTFAAWWSWHGGVVWGPRFLLVPLPLLALTLAPMFQAAARRRVGLAGVAALAALSVGVQLLGALLNYLYYESELFVAYWPDLETANIVQRTSPPMYNPALSPLVGHLRLLLDGYPLDPAWLRDGVDAAHLGAALLLAAAGVAAGFSRRLAARGARALALAAALIALNVVPARQRGRSQQVELAALDAALQPPAATLVASSHFGDGLLDLERSGRVVAMHAPTSPADPLAQSAWARALALADGGSLWYVSWFAPGHPDNWQERALFEQAYFAAERSASGHRALWFSLAPDPPAQPGGWRFGPVALEAYSVETAADGLRVALRWAAVEAVPADYTWFVHLLNADSAVVAQQDRAPLGGFAPTASWSPGQRVTDRLFFPLPPGTETAGWALRVGWVHPASGDRLPAAAPDGAPLPDGFALIKISSNQRRSSHSIQSLFAPLPL
ncbi:MAG: hypothetical protein ACUVSX_03440 [Aggregatilineales bacterium]